MVSVKRELPYIVILMHVLGKKVLSAIASFLVLDLPEVTTGTGDTIQSDQEYAEPAVLSNDRAAEASSGCWAAGVEILECRNAAADQIESLPGAIAT
jgi:hypothetical protein